MTDPRWAALAAEIAYEINPVSAVIPGKEILARVARFVEATIDRDFRALQNARASVTPGLTGKFACGAYIMLTNADNRSADVGAIARVLGYCQADDGTKYVVVQWSRDRYSPTQSHGEYYEHSFTLITEDDPF